MIKISDFFILLIALHTLVECSRMKHNDEYYRNKERIRLDDVEAITLVRDRLTNSRRTGPIPQLKCVKGGSASCNLFLPSAIQCYNRGSNGIDIQWECKSEMSLDLKFGTLQVSCEGYDYPDDPYILAGSCGLEYTIDYVNPPKKLSNSMAIAILIIILTIIVWVCMSQNSGSPNRTGSNANSGSTSTSNPSQFSSSEPTMPSAPNYSSPDPPGFQSNIYPDANEPNTFTASNADTANPPKYSDIYRSSAAPHVHSSATPIPNIINTQNIFVSSTKSSSDSKKSPKLTRDTKVATGFGSTNRR